MGPKFFSLPRLSDLPWRLILRFAHAQVVEGVDVRVFDTPEIAREVFDRAAEALRLIAESDPDRYARLRSDLAVVLFSAPSGGQYLRRLNTCRISVDYARRKSALELAMMIVHEATHARLLHGETRDAANDAERERSERACVQAEVEFASRIPGSEDFVARSLNMLEEHWWTDDAQAKWTARELTMLGVPTRLVRILEWIYRKRNRSRG